MLPVSVGNDVGLTGTKRMAASVGQLMDDLALQHVDHMAASAPMIGYVAF